MMSDLSTMTQTDGSQGIVCTLEPSIDAQQNYFAILGVQPSCEVDLEDLANRYRRLQQAVHPDKFLRECDRSQRLAQQQAALVNEAYRTVKSPLARVQYLLEMVGQNQAQSETSKDVAFLMQQMELRQRLDQVVGDLDALDELFKDVRESIMEYLDAFSVAWSAANWQEARNVIVKLQFASKLSSEIEDRQARLLDV